MNYHPFELKIEQLEAINKELETISEAEAAKTNGGLNFTTRALGEEGGSFTTMVGEGGISPRPPLATTAFGEGGISPQPPLLATTACSETGC